MPLQLDTRSEETHNQLWVNFVGPTQGTQDAIVTRYLLLFVSGQFTTDEVTTFQKRCLTDFPVPRAEDIFAHPGVAVGTTAYRFTNEAEVHDQQWEGIYRFQGGSLVSEYTFQILRYWSIIFGRRGPFAFTTVEHPKTLAASLQLEQDIAAHDHILCDYLRNIQEEDWSNESLSKRESPAP